MDGKGMQKICRKKLTSVDGLSTMELTLSVAPSFSSVTQQSQLHARDQSILYYAVRIERYDFENWRTTQELNAAAGDGSLTRTP
jgi:hypothetical protein